MFIHQIIPYIFIYEKKEITESLGCSFLNVLARFVAVMSIYIVCDFSIVAACPSVPAVRFAFCLCFIRFVVVVLSGEPKQNKGRGLVDRKLVQAPQ